MHGPTLLGRVLIGIAMAAAVFGCPSSSDEEAPLPILCTETDTKPECLPTDWKAEAQGDPSLPSADTLLEKDPPIETGSLAVTAAGGTVTMNGGFKMVVPAGALAAGTTVSIFRHAYENGSYGGGQSLYRFKTSNGASPTNTVQVSFPVAGITPTSDPARAYVIGFHQKEPAEILRGTVDGAAGTVTVGLTRFSSYEAKNDPDPPPAPAPLPVIVPRIPYYPQGGSQNCWSMSLAMLLNSVGAHVAPWENNTFFHVKVEDGLIEPAFNVNPEIVQYIKSKVPEAVIERQTWAWKADQNNDALFRYYVAKLGQGKPIMTFYFSNDANDDAAHMVLFIGVDGEHFVLHDPQNAQGDGAYQRRLWSQILPRFNYHGRLGITRYALTLVLDQDSPKAGVAAQASLVVPAGVQRGSGVDFLGFDEQGKTIQDTKTSFMWYLAATKTWGIMDLETKAATKIAKNSHAWANLAVTNLSDDVNSSATFDVGFEIRSKTTGAVTYTHPPTPVTLRGRQINENVKLVTSARGQPLREMVKDAGDYEATFFVSNGGARQDAYSLAFTVPEAPPNVVRPSQCASLTEEYRSRCKTSNCFCIGNAYCEGALQSQPASCEDAKNGCYVFCAFQKDECDCSSFCDLLYSRLGCR